MGRAAPTFSTSVPAFRDTCTFRNSIQQFFAKTHRPPRTVAISAAPREILVGNKKTTARQLTIISVLVIALTSCTVSKKYQQPELELPKQFGSVSFSDTSSIADIEWKSFFRDATLQKLIDKGINYNQDLLIAIKRREIAQQRLSQSKLLQLPEINEGEYTQNSGRHR